jgi:hypothetical protein
MIPSPRYPSRWLALLACTVLSLSGSLRAQPDATGAITGRIANGATGAYLEGAEVSVGGGVPVLTDRNGVFTLERVPTGPQRLRVYYTGLDLATPTVDVRAGVTATLDVNLTSAVLQLEAFTVSADREGEAA